MDDKEHRAPTASSSSLKIMLVLGVIGLLISVYLVVDHFDDSENAFCDFSSHISCTKVKNSVWSELFNVPVAVFGVLWFLVLNGGVIMAMVYEGSSNRKIKVLYTHFLHAVFLWCAFGTAFVFYLVYAEILLSTICPNCTVIHIITLIMLYLSWKLCQQQSLKPTITETVGTLKHLVIFIGIINLLTIVVFNLPLPTSKLGDPTPEISIELVECLAENNWNFYGITGCSYCENQKKMFGSLMDKVPFHDCLEIDCSDKGLKGYPTWIQEVDGRELARWTGYASLKNLQVFSGCNNGDFAEE